MTTTLASTQILLDARSQFVAFVSSSIERCGVGSAAKLVSQNGALCESFGRDWVVCCCRQIGTTIAIERDAEGYKERGNVSLFMGVSATLGVVWCSWLDQGSLILKNEISPVLPLLAFIEGCVGDDRFVANTHSECSGIVGSDGKVVATLDGGSYPFALWAINKKWLVRVENPRDYAKLILWRLKNGMPVNSDGVGVKCTVSLTDRGVRFFQADPYSDELVFAGGDATVAVLSFVDLERSFEAGVTVGCQKRVSIPDPHPFDFVWSSPNTILTLHKLHGTYEVYNTVTGELVHTFPSEKYQNVYRVPPGEKIAAITWNSTCEVYSCTYSDLGQPLCQFHCPPPAQSRMSSSSKAVFPVPGQRPALYIHDSLTGKPMKHVENSVELTTVIETMAATPKVTKTEILIEPRSQFVAFASSSIERCGVGSAAKLLSHNRELCEAFGRDWVVGCCRQIGATILVSGDAVLKRRSANIHVFMGVSATLGVAWCTCLEETALLLDNELAFVEGSPVGDDRFVASSMEGVSSIVDSKGKVVEALDSDVATAPSAYWVCNSKWIVRVNFIGGTRSLALWRVARRFGRGVDVRCSVPISGVCSAFSPFDPCGDELLAVGNNDQNNSGASGSSISFVDLEKSFEAGVTVVTKESVVLPYSSPFDLVWAPQNTMLALHSGTGAGYRVYNTNTGQLLHTFSDVKYQWVHALPPSHIAALSRDNICEVYCASSNDLGAPSWHYKFEGETLNCTSLSLRAVKSSFSGLVVLRNWDDPSSPSYGSRVFIVKTLLCRYTTTVFRVEERTGVSQALVAPGDTVAYVGRVSDSLFCVSSRIWKLPSEKKFAVYHRDDITHPVALMPWSAGQFHVESQCGFIFKVHKDSIYVIEPGGTAVLAILFPSFTWLNHISAPFSCFVES
ncbi:hypothetical protein Pelo_805 [Pelomyxa schiedti]|nr:hypothetical protein Pelo_805 [Pelomyxa schiedti]